MLDIRFVRVSPEIVKADLLKRNAPEKIAWVDEILVKDARSRELKVQTDELRRRRNTIARDINEARKSGKDPAALMAEAAELPGKIKENDTEQEEISNLIRTRLMRLPNVLHESVPQGKDDTGNVEIRRVGTPRTFDFEVRNHGQLAADRGWADFERAAKTSGAGFYFLKGSLVMLDLALQHFALDLLEKKGFMPVIPPFMINRSSYEGVTDLDDFEKVMYKIDGDDAYLIATSEHPIAAMYQDEIFEEKDLPLRLAGLSPCFRREIGAHGLDTKGLFRVHQFTKIEQFVFCRPEDSWQIHEELLANAEEVFCKTGSPLPRGQYLHRGYRDGCCKEIRYRGMDAPGERLQGGCLLLQLHLVPGSKPQYKGAGQGKFRVKTACPYPQLDRHRNIKGAAVHPRELPEPRRVGDHPGGAPPYMNDREFL